MSIIVRENNKLEETKLIYQPTLKVEGTVCESIMYIHINNPGPQLATSRTLINTHLPYIVRMNSNLAQEWKVTCDMKFAPCHVS